MVLTDSELRAIVRPSNTNRMIQHHGVKGMHWGKHIKRFKTALREHELNKATKEASAHIDAGEKKAKAAGAHYDRKISKMKEKGNTEKANKLAKRKEQAIANHRNYSKRLAEARVSEVTFKHLQKDQDYNREDVANTFRKMLKGAALDVAFHVATGGRVQTEYATEAAHSLKSGYAEQNKVKANKLAQERIAAYRKANKK